MKFPTIKDVAEDLRNINANVEGECDVRLQVLDNGAYYVRCGDPSYDPSHEGYWGASIVPGVVNGNISRFDARSMARELIEQVKDMYCQSR